MKASKNPNQSDNNFGTIYNAWKPTAYYISGIIGLVIFAAMFFYTVYCAIR